MGCRTDAPPFGCWSGWPPETWTRRRRLRKINRNSGQFPSVASQRQADNVNQTSVFGANFVVVAA
jgi:hypothetical protein